MDGEQGSLSERALLAAAVAQLGHVRLGQSSGEARAKAIAKTHAETALLWVGRAIEIRDETPMFESPEQD